MSTDCSDFKPTHIWNPHVIQLELQLSSLLISKGKTIFYIKFRVIVDVDDTKLARFEDLLPCEHIAGWTFEAQTNRCPES